MSVEFNPDLTGPLQASIDQIKVRKERARRRRADLNASEPAVPFQALNTDAAPMLGVAWGLSKREVFAALALQGIIASGGSLEFLTVAQAAVEYADDLLMELAKEPT